MQVQELLKLINWIEENITANQIIQKYTALQNGMNQNVSARNNRPKQPFDTQKEALIAVLPKINFDQLSFEQINLLEKLEIKDSIGVKGAEIIEDILYKKSLDIAAAAQEITQITQKITAANTKFTAIKTSLDSVFDSFEDEEIPDGSVFMRVYFSGDSAIKDVSQLKRLGGLWYDIGRGIAMVNGKSPEDFKIVGAQKGSVILELIVLAKIATSVSVILLAGLKVTEKVIDILKKAEELKKLKLGNKKIAIDLEKEAEKERTEGVKNITAEIVKKLKLKPKEEGDKVTALEKSIKNIIDFTEKGGLIDFIQPNEEAEENVNGELKEFRKNCVEIRQIEDKIKMLEEGDNSED